MNRLISNLLAVAVVAISAIACSTSQTQSITLSGLDPLKFDTIANGKTVALYTLTNNSGMEVCVTNFGTCIVSVMVPDRDGVMRDVVLGFDNIGEYMSNTVPFGATMGRCANRIRGAKFSIDGVEYKLDNNNNGNCLHGGENGWHGKIFDVEEVSKNSITMSYSSPDGESGFPGNVEAKVKYTLDDMNSINIEYLATTDAPTVVNLTNHSYFCLSGDPSKSMMNSSLMMKSDLYAPKLADNIPSGELVSVEGTPFDFREPVQLDECIEKHKDGGELMGGRGFAVTISLRNEEGDDEADIVLSNPDSGIVMEIFTSQPSVQFFSCFAYDAVYVGKGGVTYRPKNAVCLETQHHPNAVNVPDWISPVLREGETYNQFCTYRFSVE